MDRLPSDETGESNARKGTTRPSGSGLMLLTLMMFGALIVMLIAQAFELPKIDYSPFLAELEKGNVREFSYRGDHGVAKLRVKPVDKIPVYKASPDKTKSEKEGSDAKSGTENGSSPVTNEAKTGEGVKSGDAAGSSSSEKSAPAATSEEAAKSKDLPVEEKDSPATTGSADKSPTVESSSGQGDNGEKTEKQGATASGGGKTGKSTQVGVKEIVPEIWRGVAARKELDFVVQLPPGVNSSTPSLTQRLRDNGAYIKVTPQVDPAFYYMLLTIAVPVGLGIFLWISIRRSQNQIFGGGGFLSSFTRSPAKRYESSKQSMSFKDVAGLTGVKAELQEIVEFLKDPTKFQKLGGRVPKGVLLNGPPGTGKTLLARAIAGEAGVPFYSVNGSEFIQMFVGVGASRVRDLFNNAKENSPAIIFIDEIDAVGRQRGAGLGGGHDEREQTLNQILGEMDGFSQTDFVIVIAATNRPDVLDPALLRPGRFDRQITVDRPTHKGRFELFKLHSRNVPLSTNVDLERLASVTIGLTGADIRNMVNEAALWAARNNKSIVEMNDFEYARDKVLMGAKREEVFSEKDKERTAYHESGHALLGWNMSGAQRIHKVTVVARGRARGVTQFVPTEESMNATEKELIDRLVVLLGGRAAEKVVYDEASVGAENDLERATALTRRMVTTWGMSARLGPVNYKLGEEDPFLGREMHRMREFSEHTLELIDEEVARILHEASDRAILFLREHRDQLESLTRELIRQEELDEREIEKILGPSAHDRNGHASTLPASHPATPT